MFPKKYSIRRAGWFMNKCAVCGKNIRKYSKYCAVHYHEFGGAKERALKESEFTSLKEMIIAAVKDNKNLTLAAGSLGIYPITLERWIKKVFKVGIFKFLKTYVCKDRRCCLFKVEKKRYRVLNKLLQHHKYMMKIGRKEGCAYSIGRKHFCSNIAKIKMHGVRRIKR